MNYIELIKQFWQCNNEIPIGCNATALYFYLVKVCNSLGWKETFKHSDRYIALQLGISINTVRLAKNKLKQLGLIDFKSPEKASKGLDGSTKYSILTISKYNTVTDMDTDTVTNTVTDMDTDTRTKLNKTKLKNKSISNDIPKEKPIRFSPPSIEEVESYCKERQNKVDAVKFFNFYESKGWMVGKNKMKDWKASVRTWEKEDKQKGGNNGSTNQQSTSTTSQDRKNEIIRRARAAAAKCDN